MVEIPCTRENSTRDKVSLSILFSTSNMTSERTSLQKYILPNIYNNKLALYSVNYSKSMQIKRDWFGILNGSCFVDQLGDESCLQYCSCRNAQ